jgi:hypothetical protein
MIVEPAGSSFLTAQKTRGRAHRFFACHFLAYAQGGQSDRTPKGRKRTLCNVGLHEHFGALCHGSDNAHGLRAKNWLGVMRLRQRFPVSSRFGAEYPQCGAGDEVALKVEGIVDVGMHAQEALGGSGRFEPLHFALVAAPQAWGRFAALCLPVFATGFRT